MRGAAVVLVILLGTWGLSRYLKTDEVSKGLVHPAPSFQVPARGGGTRSLSDYSGHPVLVHFWATWCRPCVEELPGLLSFARNQPGIRVLAISQDRDWAEVERFLAREKVPAGVTVGLDPDQKTGQAFGTFQLPETYLVDPHGKIIFKWVGSQNWTVPEVPAFLERILRAPDSQ